MAGIIQKRESKLRSNRGAWSVVRLFWHASFGCAGLLNDLDILNLSPLLESLIYGTFTELEQSSMLVPFEVAGNLFICLFVLVDGICPHTRDLSKESNYLWQMPRSVTTLLGRRRQEKTSNAPLGNFKVAFRWWQGLFLDISWKKLATLSHHVWSCTICVCQIESWAVMYVLGTMLPTVWQLMRMRG